MAKENQTNRMPSQNGLERLAAAMERIADALECLGSRVSEDESLSFAIARGFERLAEALERNNLME